MSTIPILSILLLLPLVFTAFISLAPAKLSRTLALAGAGITFLASLLLLVLPGFPATGTPTRFEEKIDWIPALGISYHVAVDGPAILLILLTTGLQLMASLYAYYQPPAVNPKAFFAWLMILETAMIGAFCAIDLILFYVFFELCLVPVYFLIGMWGGRHRIPAATKFFVYTVVGSLLMLASIIGAHLLANSIAPGTNTFDFATIKHALDSDQATRPIEVWLFAGFVIAFAVKAGIFPLHTWLPDTYAEAPTAAVVLLSGVMAKLGTYGLYRFGIGLFSDTAHEAGTLMIWLGVISIIYGALIAAVQSDIKRVLAYSSISHLGFVTIGLFAFTPPAMSGAFLQMANHGVTSGADSPWHLSGESDCRCSGDNRRYLVCGVHAVYVPAGNVWPR
jgi:NADH-quinone oxidoreductase subunit M